MTPHKQLYRHDADKGVYGDCQRTVFACLLDLAKPGDVPHFSLFPCTPETRDAVFWANVERWLGEHGYRLFTVCFPGETDLTDVKRTMGVLNPGVYYMLSGTSANGANHVVICLGDAVAHDPAIDNSGVVAPSSDGFWRVEVLVPTALTTWRRPDGVPVEVLPQDPAPAPVPV